MNDNLVRNYNSNYFDYYNLENFNYVLNTNYMDLKYDIDFVWVKGHADNEYNNRCDKLANNMAMKFRDMYK